jgi:hypothetical protein
MKLTSSLKIICATIMTIVGTSTHVTAASAQTPLTSHSASETQESVGGILVLTTGVGDMAREILSRGANRPSEEKVLVSAASASSVLAYAEIDSLELSDRERIEAVKFAISIGTPVLLESDSWDVERLHNVVEAIFPGTKTSGLTHTGVLLRSAGGSLVSVEDADFSDMQLLAGIPDQLTTDKTLKSDLVSSKAAVHQTVYFAAKAYEKTPSDSYWNLIYNGDVVDIWQSKSVKVRCLVAWRGTDSFGDWIRDIQSMGVTQIPNTPSGNKAGSGFVDRWKNVDDIVKGRLFDADCGTLIVTGHSLGGAMAHVHTFAALFDPEINVVGMRAYNSARAFNGTAQATFQSKKGQLEEGYGIYCRDNDPVNPVPFGLLRGGLTGDPNYGCTTWAPRKSLLNPISNHTLSHWWQ